MRISEMNQDERNKALRSAVINGNLKRIQSLVDAGADVNAYGEDKYYQNKSISLHTAVFLLQKEAAALLLANNADINLKDEHGNAALHIAVRGNELELVSLLVDNNADINITDSRNQTPLMKIFEGVTQYEGKKERLEIVEYLIQNHADLNIQDINKDTALHLAVVWEQADILHLLLKSGADYTIKNENGKTPLMLAELKQSSKMATVIESFIQQSELDKIAQSENNATITTL